MLNPNYIMRKVVLDKDSISRFIINDEDRRRIHQGKVLKILASLDKNHHFSSPYVTNLITVKDKEHLIDANHRHEAIKLKIIKNPTFNITVWIATYKDLTDAEEKEVYKDWNIGTPQSATDFYM